MFQEKTIKLFIIITSALKFSWTIEANPITIFQQVTGPSEKILYRDFLIRNYFLQQMNDANLIYSPIPIVSLLGLLCIYKWCLSQSWNNYIGDEYYWIISIIIGCCLWAFKGYKIYTFKKEFNVILWKYFTANIVLAVVTIIASCILGIKEKPEDLIQFIVFYISINIIYLFLDFLINTISSSINFHYNFFKEDLQLLKNNKPIETKIDKEDIKIDENSTIKEDADKNKK